jgi:hypothetical protein
VNAKLLSIFCLLLSGFSCEESLPPHEEPRDFLESTYTVTESVVEIRDSMVQNAAGTFVISVKNVYVEVLQDEEFARGEVDVWLRDQPQQHGRILATRRDLTNQTLVYGGILTLRPNETATFLKQWQHRTTEGRWFWEFVRLTEKRTSHGGRYMESDSVRFIAKGKAQLFKTRAPESLPSIQFTLVYRIF